jgi:tape measure domain-containing protein
MTGAAAVLTTGLIGRGIGSLINAASDIETVTTEFETLTGSIENAAMLVDQLRQFTARTPLQFEAVSEGTKRLLAFGIAQEDVLSVMQTLGDAALGDANKLDSLTRAYGKVAARGRVSMEEINMVIDAGVPIMDALNAQLGTNTEQLQGMISRGEVTADIFQSAFRDMTTGTGQFAGGMERLSETQKGLWSTLKDNILLVAGSMGESLLPTTKSITENLINVAQKVKEWISANKELINSKLQSFLNGVKAVGDFIAKHWQSGLIPALLAGVATFKLVAMAIVGAQGLIAAIKMIKAAMAAGSLMSMFNPWTLLAAVIVGLVVLIIKNWDKVKAFLIKVWEAIKTAGLAVWEGIKIGVKAMADFVKMYFFTVADIILTVFGNVVKAVLGVVSTIGKALGLEMNGVESTIDRISQAQANVRSQSAIGAAQGLISANQGVQESRSTTENRSTVDVNFNNTPQGTTIRQRGRAPGLQLNTGYGGTM